MNRSQKRISVSCAVGSLLASVAITSVTGSSAEAASYVKNSSFSKNTSGWSASKYATKSRVRTSVTGKPGFAVRVKSKAPKGKKSAIKLTSSLSSARVPSAGSTVQTSARIRTSKPRVVVHMRVEEVRNGKVVSYKQSRKVSKSGWFSARAELKTTKPGSRLRVWVRAGALKRGQYFQFTQVKVAVNKKSSSSSPSPKPKPVPQVQMSCEQINYKDPKQGGLTYADEFNGTKLDPKQWRVRDNTFLNQDAAFISNKNVSVHDGYLDIMGRREPQANWRSNTQSLFGEENRVRKYSTGYVDSIKSKTYESADAASADRFSQRYGYFEARMLVPSTNQMSQGIWPAFWLRADSNLGEIDIMESYGSPTIRNNFDPSRSYEWNSWQDTSQKSTRAHFLGRPTVSEPIHKDWHVFGVNWSPTCLRYTMDGKTVGVARPIAGEVPYLNGPTFASPFHIRFNMQIGSKFWGWSDPTVTKDQFHFKIDYVRVYQGKAHTK